MGSLVYFLTKERPLALEVQSLSNQIVRLDISILGYVMAFAEARSSLMEKIRAHLFNDVTLRLIQAKVFSVDPKES